MLKIRDVREEDRVELFGMQKDFYSGEACEHSIPEENFEATLRECIRSREYGRLLIIEDEQGIAGYFLLAITWSNEAGGQVVWLEEAYFKEKARGKGYGRQVFGWVEKEYPRARRFRLEATAQNKKAIALYQRLGYRELPYVQMVKDAQ